jgi:CHAD domain-containing protein/adenylate cyclase class IV
MTDVLDRPLEVELKYRMTDVATGERLLAADELAGFAATGPAERVEHRDRYLDTADGALEAAGFAGRLRTTGNGTILTLKGLERQDDGGAKQRRIELEGPADPSQPPSAWPSSEARDAVIEIAGDRRLEDLVSLRQVRRKREYARNGTVVEVSVDDVEVLVGADVAERFAELELELRAGQEVDLEPLADMLGEIEELVAVDSSKLERALEVVRREPRDGRADEDAVVTVADLPPAGEPSVEGATSTRSGAQRRRRRKAAQAAAAEQAVASAEEAEHAPITLVAVPMAVPEPAPEAPRILVPKSPGVLADDHIAEAGRKVLRFHLARMVAREAGTRDGSDAEELHAMRVATRRQRAAWRVFGEAFDRKRTARHRKRLRFVAADLGAVRDLDVLIESIEAYQKRQSETEAAALEPLVRSWRVRRETAREVLVRELDSERYRRWLDGYLAFVQAEGQAVHAVGPTEPHRVRDTMPSRVWAAYENVRAYEPVMRWADVATLHDLRIAAKWLRYTLEFVREALGRDAGPVIEKVVALQDHIGWLHDADVAAGLARGFLVEHAGDLTEQESAAIGRYLVDRERTLAKLRRTVGAPWRGVSSLAFRRALGRLVAGL